MDRLFLAERWLAETHDLVMASSSDSLHCRYNEAIRLHGLALTEVEVALSGGSLREAEARTRRLLEEVGRLLVAVHGPAAAPPSPAANGPQRPGTGAHA
jgi:hypothetical protein